MQDHTDKRPNVRTGPSPLKVGLVLAPIAAIVVAGVWIGVNLGRSPASSGSEAAGQLPYETLEAVVSAARKYMSEGSPGRAEAILAAAAEKFPQEQSLVALRAKALLDLGRHAEALGEYERACFIGPESATYRDFAGILAAQIGDDERADAHWAIAQKLAPENPKYPLYRAQVQRRLGNNDGARANLILATRLDPNIAEAWATLAAIALDENRIGMVGQYIARARELEPGNSYFRVIEAKGLRRGGDAVAAANLLYAIPEQTRLTDRTVLQELALCCGMMNEPGRAADLYVAATELLRDDAQIAYEAALWLRRAGRTEQARTMAERAKWLGSPEAATLLSQMDDG